MASEHTANQACLLGIPAELRLNIYSKYLDMFILDTSTTRLDQDDLQAPLLNACELVRREALPLCKIHLEDASAVAEGESQARLEHHRRMASITGRSFEVVVTRHDSMILHYMEQQEWVRVSQAYASELGKIEEVLSNKCR